MKPQTKGGCTCDVDGWPCPDCQQRFYSRSYQVRIPQPADRWYLLALLSFMVFMFPEEAHPMLGGILMVGWWIAFRRSARRRA